jgi:hypothetical protein
MPAFASGENFAAPRGSSACNEEVDWDAWRAGMATAREIRPRPLAGLLRFQWNHTAVRAPTIDLPVGASADGTAPVSMKPSTTTHPRQVYQRYQIGNASRDSMTKATGWFRNLSGSNDDDGWVEAADSGEISAGEGTSQ